VQTMRMRRTQDRHTILQEKESTGRRSINAPPT
jgi:hypothetical protein